MQRPEGSRLMVLAPLSREPAGSYPGLLKRLRKDGFARVRIDGKIQAVDSDIDLSTPLPERIDVVVDRLILNPRVRNRLADSMELAIARSEGQVEVAFVDQRMESVTETLHFSENAACKRCGVSYPELSPASFSFNSPHGACPHCDGLGTTRDFSPLQIVPNPELSLREGAISVWAHRRSVAFTDFPRRSHRLLRGGYLYPIQGPSRSLQIRPDDRIRRPADPFTTHENDRTRKELRPFEGILSHLQRQYAHAASAAEKKHLDGYMAESACAHCGGSRLRRESRHIRIDGLSISDLTSRSITASPGVL
jgi:excinuclease ABC subunit A